MLHVPFFKRSLNNNNISVVCPFIKMNTWIFDLQVTHANSVSDLYKAIGEDFWSSTWCNSTAFEG